MVAIRAYRKALEVGDLVLAGRAVTVLESAGVAPGDAALLRFAGAWMGGDRTGADAALARLAGGQFAFLAPLIRAWTMVDKGGDAVGLLDRYAGPDSAIGRRYAAEQRPLLLIAKGRAEDGVEALGLAVQFTDPDLRIEAAQFLAGTGRPDLAVPLLRGEDPRVARIAATLGNGIRPSAAVGAARLLTKLADDLGPDAPAALKIALTRTALLLEPGDDHARLLLAEGLAHSANAAGAIAVLEGVPAASPFADDARDDRVMLMATTGDTAAAVSAARAMAEAPGAGAREAQTLGDRLVAAGRPDEAARAYALANARAGGDDWRLLFLQGSTLDLADRWAEARPLLERAAALAPDQPAVLNTLGYGMLERGERPDEAQRLLERAARLRPESGSIADSLGWSYARQGDPARALPLLEKAAVAEPGNTTINEHLGDVYWRLGRRYEARYAWAAAAVFAADSARGRIAAKIAGQSAPAAR